MITFKTDDCANNVEGSALRAIATQNPFVSDSDFEDTYKQTRLIQTKDQPQGKAGETLRRGAIWLEAASDGEPLRAVGHSKKPDLLLQAICAEVYKSIISGKAPAWYELYGMVSKLRRVLQNKYQKGTSTTSTQALLDLYQLIPSLVTAQEDQLIDPLFDIESVCVPQFIQEFSFPQK